MSLDRVARFKRIERASLLRDIGDYLMWFGLYGVLGGIPLFIAWVNGERGISRTTLLVLLGNALLVVVAALLWRRARTRRRR